jgi:DNA replication and repair protein RecF
MYIKSIKLESFRNYSSEGAEFSENINMITGENAQGKTNLLESIYFTSFGKSFRTNRDKEMIMLGRDYCRVSADYVVDGDDERAEVALSRDGRKAVKISGRKVEKISELINSFLTVIFSPEDMKIVKDEPEKRRRFIDSELCQLSLAYYEDLSKYKKILAQRNMYLKSGSIDETMLDIWDESLADHGSRIIRKRKDFIGRLSGISENIHSNITNGKENSKIEYDSQIEYRDDPGEQKELFLKELKNNRQRDIEHGSTHRGPHRDDIDIKIDGMSTRRFGSQGQQRTVALSMKLAEIELIKEEKDDYPVLLLDDVFSELDVERQRYLVEYLKRMQVFITSAEISEKMEGFFPDSRKIIINKGTISCY